MIYRFYVDIEAKDHKEATKMLAEHIDEEGVELFLVEKKK